MDKRAEVIGVAGHKGGVAKTTLAQLLAVEAAAKGRDVVVIDLDKDQRSLFEWAGDRARNGFEPRIRAVLIDPDTRDDFGISDFEGSCDLIIIDAPGWSDESTAKLAARADLLVLPCGTSVKDLRPTIRLMHELVTSGIAREKLVVAFCKVQTLAEAKWAREYLEQAGFEALPSMVRFMTSVRLADNEGRAASEVDGDLLQQEAKQLAAGINKVLANVRKARADEPQRFQYQPLRFQRQRANEGRERS